MSSLVSKCEHCLFSRRDSLELPGRPWELGGQCLKSTDASVFLSWNLPERFPWRNENFLIQKFFWWQIYLISFFSFFFFNWSTDDSQYCVNFHTWSFPGKHTGMGSHSFLQGIILTQRLNLGLWHCRQILYHLSHRGSPGYRCTAKWSSYTYFFKGYFPL